MFVEINNRLGAIREPQPREAMVFIHGFNVPFKDAIERTAQLAADLELPIPILYSWASQGNVADYIADGNSAQRTVDNLQRFL